MSTKPQLIETLKARLLLAERFKKDWVKNIKKWEQDYNIETLVEGKIASYDNLLQIPYIFSTIESGLPSMFETIPSVIMRQRGKEDRDFTEFADKVWAYIKEKTDLEERIEEAGAHFLVTGMGIIKYGWHQEVETIEEEVQAPVTNEDGSPVLDETGAPVTQTTLQKVQVPVKDIPFIRSLTYKEVLFSPESKFTEDDEENLIPYIMCLSVKLPETAQEEFGVKVKEESIKNIDLKEINKDMELSEDDKNLIQPDLGRVNVYEYYGVLPKKDSGDKNWRSSKVYYSAFTKEGQILKKPEEIGKKNILLAGNYGLPTQFWPFGEPKVLRELEQDVSLGRSRIADLRDKQGTKIAIPQGTEVDERALKKSADYVIMRFVGTTLPQYVTPPPISETIMVALQQSREDLQMASAQLDISRGGAQSVVDTATGQKIFQQSTDKRNNRKRKKIAKMIKNIAKNVLVLCANNWDIETFSKITDMPSEEIKQNQFIEKMKDLGNEYDVEIEVEDITNNKETMAAQAIALYKEVREDPLVNREEVLKQALKIGFGIKDFERFLSGLVTPDQVIATLQYLVENGIMDQPTAETIILALRAALGIPEDGSVAENNGVGRPAVNTPTDIVKKAMPPADSTQITAQRGAAYKQTGVPKGPQNT